MSKRLNPLIAKAQEKIDKLPHADRRRFYRALRYSVSGNGKEPPKPYNAEEIADLTGVAPKVQLSYYIVVSKKMALEFFEGLGYPVKKEAFKKRVKGEEYEEFFKKKPCRVANKLVFSYLEIMALEGVNMTVELPSGEED